MDDKKLGKQENYDLLHDLVYLKSADSVSNMTVDAVSDSSKNEEPLYMKHAISDSSTNEALIYMQQLNLLSEQSSNMQHIETTANLKNIRNSKNDIVQETLINKKIPNKQITKPKSKSQYQPSKSAKKKNSNIRKFDKKAKQVNCDNKNRSLLILVIVTVLTIWAIINHNGIKLSNVIDTIIDKIYNGVEDKQNKSDLIIESQEGDSNLDNIRNDNDNLGVEVPVVVTETELSKNEETSNTPTTLVEVGERITPILSGYLSNFALAINEGNFNMIESYILYNSELYIQQKSYIPKIFERGIKEEFLGYSISNITYDFENHMGVVSVSETYAIIKPIQGTRNENTYQNRYEFELNPYTNEFLLTKLYLD